MSRLLTSLLAALALPAFAYDNVCDLVKPEEINLVAATKVEKFSQTRSGNPAECVYTDARKGSVLVITVREVKYAVKDEMQQERDNLEKIYKTRSKTLDTVGEGGYWLPVNHQLGFRKAKTIVTVRFSPAKNQNEVDSGQIARVIETRLGKEAPK